MDRNSAVCRAFEHGQDDAREAIRWAQDAADTLAHGETQIYVDGSYVAPSWRALDGGEAVWELEGTPDTIGDAIGAYVEELDVVLGRTYGRRQDCSLYWTDGMLVLERADEDGEYREGM